MKIERREYEITRLIPKLFETPKSGRELRRIRREIIRKKFGRLKI